jgi:hypothetical protein
MNSKTFLDYLQTHYWWLWAGFGMTIQVYLTITRLGLRAVVQLMSNRTNSVVFHLVI